MHADRCEDERVAVRQPHCDFKIGRSVACSDGEHALHTGGARPLDHLLAIFVELGIVQMAVGVDQLHFSRAPTGMSSWKPANTGFPSATDAATIIPFDSMPFSLRGCRLATITTFRWISASGP